MSQGEHQNFFVVTSPILLVESSFLIVKSHFLLVKSPFLIIFDGSHANFLRCQPSTLPLRAVPVGRHRAASERGRAPGFRAGRAVGAGGTQGARTVGPGGFDGWLVGNSDKMI